VKQAARNGNIDVLKLLFENWIHDKWTLPFFFMQAIEGGAACEQLDVIRFLMQEATSRELLDKKDPRIEILYAGKRNFPMFDLIFLQAIFNGHKELAQRALNYGADPNAQYPGPSPMWSNSLTSACLKGHEDIVLMLLSRIRNLKHHSNISVALYFAISRGWVRIARILQTHEHQIHKNMLKRQLLVAIKCGQVESVRLLLRKRTDEIKSDPETCRQAYSLSVSRGFTSIARQLNEHVLGTAE